MEGIIELRLNRVLSTSNEKPSRIWMLDNYDEDWLGFLRKEGDKYIIIPVTHEELLDYRCGKTNIAKICRECLDMFAAMPREEETIDICEGNFESDGKTIYAKGGIMDRERYNQEFSKGRRRYPNPYPEDETDVDIEEMRLYCPDLLEEIFRGYGN